MRRFALLVVLTLSMPRAAAAAPQPYHGGQFRYWLFNDKNDLRDYLYYVVPGRWHGQIEYWDFVSGDDQLRPELGLHLPDRRGSVYTLAGRAEMHLPAPHFSQYRFWLGTDQLLSDHVVGRVQVDVITSPHFHPEYVETVGGDYYWGSWNFFSASAIHDPRESGLWTFPCRLRVANEDNDWIQFTLAPAVHQTWGWAVDLKKGWVRAGIERNDRYDFTNRNNVIFTLGFEKPLGRRP